MKKLLVLTVGLLLLGSMAFATWDDAAGHALCPYWQTGGNWYTLVTVVNGSEETQDVLYVRFFDVHGNPCSDVTGNMYSIRQKEMLIFSTTASVPTWIPVSAGFGYLMFRAQDGGYIHPYTVIYNQVNGTGYVVPWYRQDAGF
ncbi:MAG: hypothetical protein JW759_00080 [Candidatus Coatesbacteria bacterium]|nr:hypothetical protein [Candidatus Coatesbacteria bacterium]